MRRYFQGYPTGRASDFDAAERHLTTALGGLEPGDPLRVDVSFCLGAIRIADHEARCGRPCPAPAELRPITELLAVGGARDGAQASQLYPYAMTVDKLYDHTHDPADIDLAIAVLRRAAQHRDVSPQDRRRVLISLAVQLANRGAAKRPAPGLPDQGRESRVAFDAAISELEGLIADLDRPGPRSDETRDEDRLDALLGLLEVYYQRVPARASDQDLDAMAAIARTLVARMTTSYRLRAYALGRCGVLLTQRMGRRIGDPWDRALNDAILSVRPAPIQDVVTGAPGLDADVDMAVEALAQAVRLADDADRHRPMFTAALCAARGYRYLARPGDEDLREFGRLCRIVLGHPHIDASYRRFCGECLLLVLVQRIREYRADPGTSPPSAVRLSPSGDAGLDTLIGLLAGFAADDGAALAPALASLLVEAAAIRSEGDLSDEELGAAYARGLAAADALANVPAAHAMLLFRAAVTGAEWVGRGTAPAGLADQVAGGFRKAGQGFPAAHPFAREIAARAAAFGRAAKQPAGASAPVGEAMAARFPLGPEAFNLRALASLGVASRGLELGRALVLHAATVAADVPALLREAGRPELAAEWDDQAVASGRRPGRDIADIPGDLRRRVLAALRSGPAEHRMLAAPTATQVAEALRAARMDQLIYLIPASDEVAGRALIVGADATVEEYRLPDLSAGPGGAVARFAQARQARRAAVGISAARRFADELDGLCEWAWRVAIGPLLGHLPATEPRPPHLVLAPMGILGIVPWQAARHGPPGDLHYACEEAVFATCASARQLIDAVARPWLRAGAGSAIFVANPGGDLPWSQQEADAMCAALYPDAIYLGTSDQTVIRGRGTPEEVLACLSPAGLHGVVPAVLHLGCHARAADSPEESRLRLADGQALPVSRILAQARTRPRGEPGGLVVLAACTSDLALSDYDEALTLSSAFLAAGATGVVGSRWEVSDLYTALLMFMFHRHLVANPAGDPADALRAAQLWMLSPRREIPAQMPPALAGHARRSAARSPQSWAAFTYHGQ
jgi:hypothetical protein